MPATGFYEWPKIGAGKQPHHIGMIDGAPFAFAGRWSSCENPEGEWVDKYTNVTTTPNELASREGALPHAGDLGSGAPPCDTGECGGYAEQCS